jgi:hypothetical protein
MTDRIVMELLATSDPVPVAGDPPPTHLVLLKIKEPEGYPGVWAFTCTGHEQVFAALASASPATDVVTAAGRLLFDAVSAPQPVRDLLTVALAVQDPDRRPIYLDLSSAKESQGLPWEALCTSTGRFLALNPTWPVGRILAGARKADPKGSLRPPFRLAAVLSCLGVTAHQEWDALRKAVESSGAPVRLQLLLSEQELHDEIVDLGLPWVEPALIPTEFGEFRHLLTTFAPHLLHFFCHGDAEGGPHLEVATAPNWLNPETPGHRLEARDIRDLVGPPAAAPWAIVLNACSSAAGAGEAVDTHSLAARLVVEHGVPAVIGMREPVLGTDAARFAGAFYAALFADVRRWVENHDTNIAIDWATYTVEARTDICRARDTLFDAAAARYKEWTLPAVVVRPTQFTVDVTDGSVTPEDRDRALRLASAASAVLGDLPPGTPAETVAALQKIRREQLLIAAGRS